MKNIATKKQMALAVSCALALGIVANAATAETNPADTGYLIDQRNTVVRSGFGLCWHSGVGPAPASSECDPKAAPAPSAQAAPAPQAVAVAPPPAPPPAPKPAAQRLTFDADTLFDFNKANLRPAGRAALDDFAGKIKGIDPETVKVVGYADRIGSEAYNQRLSEQRAASVKSYLISTGIDANRIHSEGKGEMQPVTQAGACNGAKSAKVIACLQPDRRVEVELVGARTAAR